MPSLLTVPWQKLSRYILNMGTIVFALAYCAKIRFWLGSCIVFNKGPAGNSHYPWFRSLGPTELKPFIETGQVQELKKEFWFVLGRGCYACDSTLCTCNIASRNIANHIKNQYLEDTRTFTAGFAKILIKIWRPQDTAKG